MLNQVILVGRLTADPELIILDDGKKVTNIRIAVQRNFKNSVTGEYDTDFMNIELWAGIAESTATYCTKGSTIGVKARVANSKSQIEGKNYEFLKLIAEKITFINKS